MTTVTESAFLSQAREQGAAAFERAPMPTRKDEYWRFTKLRGVELSTVPQFAGADDLDAVRTRVERSLTAAVDVAGELLHVNYETLEGDVRTNDLPEGVVFSSLATAAAEHAELFERHFGSVVAIGETCDDKFV